ncbi:MAG: aldehyde dehydrogenase family protein, partial [Thermoplasmata archaeon]|nr:aldehyde dehydrogenase family protein [Thermoplasmata archaeon]
MTPRKGPTKPSAKKATARRRSITVINPATGEVLATRAIASGAQVRAAVDKARTAFGTWSRLAPTDRAVYLSHLAEILRKHRGDYARTMTLEMGKVIRESNAEVEKCAWAADVFAKDGPRFLEPEPVGTE